MKKPTKPIIRDSAFWRRQVWRYQIMSWCLLIILGVLIAAMVLTPAWWGKLLAGLTFVFFLREVPAIQRGMKGAMTEFQKAERKGK